MKRLLRVEKVLTQWIYGTCLLPYCYRSQGHTLHNGRVPLLPTPRAATTNHPTPGTALIKPGAPVYVLKYTYVWGKSETSQQVTSKTHLLLLPSSHEEISVCQKLHGPAISAPLHIGIAS